MAVGAGLLTIGSVLTKTNHLVAPRYNRRMLNERPNCPVHKKPMIPWQFPAKKESAVQGAVYGYKCLELNCELVYSDDLGGFCTVTPDGTPLRFQGPA